ncbi:MAG: hypothetical protein DWQ02_20830 [Bacteroidetes bacterium]|nr:MAG: hypothetical protein DWQ02_20830 [Bacteroidota bacterium]
MTKAVFFPKPEDLLPHDKPMSLVDEIVNFDCGKTLEAVTTYDPSDFFYQGHFKDNPVTPGIILVETMFQTCGLLLRLSSETSRDFPPIMGRAVKIKNATFSREVKPNEEVRIHVKFKSRMMHFFTFDCHIKVNGQVMCKSELVLS